MEEGPEQAVTTAAAVAARRAHVMSLGASCFPAAQLREHGLRRYAGPFDWIFSSPQMVNHCLQDNFASFLDASQYRDCGQAGKAGHTMYSEMLGRATVFNHHDPRIAEHYDYLCRATARLQHVLALPPSERKVFLLCSLESGFHIGEAELDDLFRRFRKQTTNFRLLALRLTRASEGRRAETVGATSVMRREAEEGSLELFDLVLQGDHEGLSLDSEEDRQVFEQLVRCRLDGYAMGLDPLASGDVAGCDGGAAPEVAAGVPPLPPHLSLEGDVPQESRVEGMVFEIVRPPSTSLSPDLKPMTLACDIVLKEGVGHRILGVLVRASRSEMPGRCRRAVLCMLSSPAAAAVGDAAPDRFGPEPALLVVPEQPPEGACVWSRVLHFLQENSGPRAAIVPEGAVDALRAVGPVAVVPKLRFPVGYDLFRHADASRVVAGGMRVQKCKRTTEAFVVVVSAAV